MNHDHTPRVFDADDLETALHRILPLLAGPRQQRVAVYSEYEPEQKQLTRVWYLEPGGALASRPLQLDAARLHPLLHDDVSGNRPLRPADSAPEWAVRDVLRGVDLARRRVRVRVVADAGRWLGVLVIAFPAGLLQRGEDPSIQTLGDTLELALGRIAARQRLAEIEQRHRSALEQTARRSIDRLQQVEREVAELRSARETDTPRLRALEDATGRATELLMEAHIELAGRTERLRRQTRVLFLLRQLLDRYAEGIAPQALAGEVVRVVSEAFGGERCSLLVVDPAVAGRRLRVAAAQGLPAQLDARNLSVDVGSGVSGWVAHHRQAMVVREEADTLQLPLHGDEAYTGPAFASLPLTCNGRLLGVLNLTNFRDGTFDDGELEALRLVARCVALVIDHARLSERLFLQPASSGTG